MSELAIVQIIMMVSVLVNVGLGIWIWILKNELEQRAMWCERIERDNYLMSTQGIYFDQHLTCPHEWVSFPEDVEHRGTWCSKCGIVKR